MKILVSAYACEPNSGSEPGIGWYSATTMSGKGHSIDVITRANNRPVIEHELQRHPMPQINFHYYDLPKWISWFKKGRRGINLYYYLWQIGAYRYVTKTFDLKLYDFIHHITLGRYWMPSFMWKCSVPLIWGPVGGGDYIPKQFWRSLGSRGVAIEIVREVVRFLSEQDPFVRKTVRNCVRAFGTTQMSVDRIRTLGAGDTHLLSHVGLIKDEFQRLSTPTDEKKYPARFVSVCELSPRKALHLSIRAFAQCNVPDKEYWIVGSGPDKPRLETLCKELGVETQVKFLGQIPRHDVLEMIKSCGVFLFPSLRDSGGFAVAEAMACGTPVVCLTLGGPGVLVDNSVGVAIEARTVNQVVADFARHMERLVSDSTLRNTLGKAAQKRIRDDFIWDEIVDKILTPMPPLSTRSNSFNG